jgi:phage-related tail fiber protein
MTKEFYSLITNIGLEKIQEALNNGTKLDLKYIAVGDSNGAYYEPSEEQMALKNERYRAEITELTSLTAKSLIPASVGGFYMREFGIFDSENNLILVGKQPETYKPVETEGSFKELWIKVVIVAINPNVIEFKIDPTIQMASQSWVLNLFNGHTHSDLMPIWLYDTNGNGYVDTCEYIDGGTFTDGEDLTLPQPPTVPQLIMSTTIYDKNGNGIVDDAENLDAGEF